MAIRKASAYSKKMARPYTRKSAHKSKAYIKTIPYSKIVKFRMGAQKDYDSGKHKYLIQLIALEGTQVRDTALEAGRMLAHKLMEEKIPGQYFFEVKVYPHHFIRENKMAAGAGADRMATGMTQSFGIVIGRMALVSQNQVILFASCPDGKTAAVAKQCMTTVKSKFPCATKVVISKVA